MIEQSKKPTDAVYRWKSADREVIDLVQQLKARQNRRRFLTAIATTTACGGGAAIGALWFLRSMTEMDYGGITCSQVASLSGKLLAGELDGPTKNQIRQHISSCPQCREKLRDMNALGELS